jgi:hypothetical protein
MPGFENPRVHDQEQTVTDAAPVPRVARVTGVDVARGTALFGMMSAHVFAYFNLQGAPSISTVITAGRSVATFAVIAVSAWRSYPVVYRSSRGANGQRWRPASLSGPC